MANNHKNTVIVIDDDEMVRETVTALTSHLNGYNPVPASSGSEALSAYRKMKDDIAYVITDYNLIGETGIDAILGLRKEGYKGPVIFMTGNSNDLDEHLRREGPSVGIHSTLAKPFMFNDYKSLVSRLME
jgi:CheY-like chemotaxis protein